jgi:hypothetical protein
VGADLKSGDSFVQSNNKKPGSTVEIVALLILIAVSIWIPKQQSLFSEDKIQDAKSESSSYLNFISSKDLLMTSDKVVLPEDWSSATNAEAFELRVLKLRSKQVRFVQNAIRDWEDGGSRSPASATADVWVLDSVKRLGINGHVETLSISDVDGERTTPYIELGSGVNDFSVTYYLKSDKSRTQRKKIRLISADGSRTSASS